MHGNGDIDYMHYKDPNDHTKNYHLVIDDLNDFQKWKNGDTSIALDSFVNTSKIMGGSQGSEGIWGTPSDIDFRSSFHTTKSEEIAKTILHDGKHKSGPAPERQGHTNPSR